jgi:putative PIN family toxin of toxin-antitoxin system
MRVLLDTNTVVSAVFWGGPPREILGEAAAGSLELFTSPALLEELAEVVARPKFAARVAAAGRSPAEIVDGYAALATVVFPAVVPQVVSADPDDDAVIACALAARAEFIVSGDRHLLSLRSHDRVGVVSAAQLLVRLRANP